MVNQLLRSYTKKTILLGADLFFVLLSLPIALFIRLDPEAFKVHFGQLNLGHFSLVFLAYLFAFVSLRTYRAIIRLANLFTALRVVFACFLGALVAFVAGNYSTIHFSLPRSTYFIQFLLVAPACICTRFSYRIVQRIRFSKSEGVNTLVFGAGLTTDRFLPFILQHQRDKIRVLGILDDDPAKKGSEVQGIRVLGGMSQIRSIVRKKGIEQVILSAPSVTGPRLRKVVDIMHQLDLRVKVLPSVEGYVNGPQDGRIDIRDLNIEDLLRRPLRSMNKVAVSKLLGHKNVLVTGGGGSIGSELVRQIAAMEPSLLIINDSSEYALYKIRAEIEDRFPNLKIVAHLANLANEKAVIQLFQKFKIDILFHACAYKHVPLVEENVCQSILNNIQSAKFVYEQASLSGCERVILISSDKAVRPTNVMGATKKLCELLLQFHSGNGKTSFSAVRFGNVLASSGSVIPKFVEQIQNGGPVTITHPDITRYFMLIPEAVSLVLQASTSSVSGEIFVLNMGEPIRIADMAKDLIRLMGKRPEIDIPLVYSGLRPGEKMYEELQCEDETKVSVTEDFFKLENSFPLSETLIERVNNLLSLCEYGLESEAKSELFEVLALHEKGYFSDLDRMQSLVFHAKTPLTSAQDSVREEILQ